MEKINLTNLEKQVINMLLSGENPTLSILRAQFEQSAVKSRELTGVGFLTEFSVPKNAPLLEDHKRLTIGNVNADIPGLKHGAGFVLFVDNRAINFLEGYTYDEKWPSVIEDFTLRYDDGKNR